MDLPDETGPNGNSSDETADLRDTPDSTVGGDTAVADQSTGSAQLVPPVLPTMTDLDRLAADLDHIDHTLADLDGAPAA